MLGQQIRARKVPQWALAYCAAAWVALQILQYLTDVYAWPSVLSRVAPIAAAGGFLLTLVLGWYHGSAGRQRPARIEVVLVMIILLATTTSAFMIRRTTESSVADTAATYHNSIAVLPFADMSAQQDQDYFSDGMTEELLNALSQIPGLRVPARTSSFSFKGKHVSVREIARHLSVKHILEGSVRKSGDRVRITAQLIDASADRHLWSQTYDRPIDDLFAVQDEITHAIVQVLQMRIAQSGALTVQQGTASGPAHDRYLKGLYYWNGRRGDELPLALDNFNAAIDEDSAYARAYAGVALTYAVLRQYVPATDRELAIRKGKAAARRALRLDPRAADAHAALSQIAQTMEWNWKEAEAHADAAVRFNPHYATGRQWRAELYDLSGRSDEALREINRALELDPLSIVMHAAKARSLERMGRQQQAATLYRTILDREPLFIPARVNLFWLSLASGDYDTALDLLGKDSVVVRLVAAVRDTSRRAATVAELGTAKRRAAWPNTVVASAYVVLGEVDSAVILLNRAADKRDPLIEQQVHNPLFTPLRTHPRFRELRNKLNL